MGIYMVKFMISRRTNSPDGKNQSKSMVVNPCVYAKSESRCCVTSFGPGQRVQKEQGKINGGQEFADVSQPPKVENYYRGETTVCT